MTKKLDSLRKSAQGMYEVTDDIPAPTRVSGKDVIIENLLKHRGKTFCIYERPYTKRERAYAFTRFLRRYAEKEGVLEVLEIHTRADWREGKVRVFAKALTQEELRVKKEGKNNP